MARANGPVFKKNKSGSASARSGNENAHTPAMQQYIDQKAQAPDAILLFRMGDFYETFYDDAKIAARVLGLTLTSRSKKDSQPIPLAGIPYHALDGYLPKLIAAGYKVAISEQVEDPRTAKGVVRREIQRIVTPGTLTDDALLDARRDRMLAAISTPDLHLLNEAVRFGQTDDDAAPSNTKVGLALVDLASGRFLAEMIDVQSLAAELTRLSPAEVILPEASIEQGREFEDLIRESIGAAVTTRPPDRFDAHRTRELLCRHFEVRTLEGFGFEQHDESLCAAGAVLDYLRETQRAALGHILSIVPRHSDDFVTVDHTVLRGLEVDRSLRDGAHDMTLLRTIDRTSNPMGVRRLREWLCHPLRATAAIMSRQDAVESLRSSRTRLVTLRSTLREMIDVQRVVGRLGVGRVTPRDLSGMALALSRLRSIVTELQRVDALPAELSRIAAACSDWDELADYLRSALRPDAPTHQRDGDYIADGFDAELDRLRALQRDGNDWLVQYQLRECERTGIASLKVAYNSVFGFYIEITHAHRDKVPGDYVRRQTLRNAERYITDELKKHEDEVLNAEERARVRESELFDAVRDRALNHLARLQSTAAALADLDVLCSFAEISLERHYCRPTVIDVSDQAPLLEIIDGRHPVLEQTLSNAFVPNDSRLGGNDAGMALITGPNMAGKSTYIRQVALLTLMAHTGSYVPATSMRWSPVDRIFARIGANDEIARGHSTFMVEMVETAQILNNATCRSLVVLDEIGRGTSTFDGLSLAWAICEHLIRDIRCRTLFATHYHELTELATLSGGVANYNVAVSERKNRDGGDEIVFLHRIEQGAADKSYGVHVARMAGVPRSVVRRSEEVLAELERQMRDDARAAKMRPKSVKLIDDDQPLLF